MKLSILLISIIAFNCQAKQLERFDEVRVYKSRHKMEMLFHGQVVKSYHVMLGRGGKGPKMKEGDNLVPEGKYTLDEKNPYSKYFRSIHINYPSAEDIERARQAGVNPGKDVFLHGTPNDFDKLTDWLRAHHMERLGENAIRAMMVFFNWTAGCVAVKNRDMAEIYDQFEGPTPITIYQ